VKKKTNKVGRKFSKGKPKMCLIPEEALFGAATVFTDAEQTHGSYNYRYGLYWTDILDALTRHVLKFQAGIELDEDSGRPNTWHILANAMMLEYLRVHHTDKDNRFSDRASVEHLKFKGNSHAKATSKKVKPRRKTSRKKLTN
jgi:hypothetical protein